jgi:hypothetical protein
MRRSLVAGIFFVGCAALACSGAGGAGGLFSAPPGADGGPSSSGSGSSSGTASGGSGSGSSSGGKSSGSSGGSSSGSSSSGGGSGSSSGGGSGGGSGSSSGGGADASTDPGIYCGKTLGSTTYCPVGTDVCCARTVGGAGSGGSGGGAGTGTTTFRCESATSSTCENAGGTPIACDNEAECSGQLCCGSLDTSSNTYVTVQCQTTCDPAQNQYIFCDPNLAPSVCDSVPTNGGPPYTCTESTSLPGFYRCSNGT